MKTAIVIGAGIAGLAVSLRLRKQGFAVSVYEANSYPGGKLSSFEQEGYRFDAGPSLFTMPQFVEELFQLYDLQPSDYFQYKRKETVCNYFWEDGKRFSVPSDKQEFATRASEEFAVPAEKLTKYLANSHGSSPYKTPGIMSMIPHLEMHHGTFFPKGGMAMITQSLYDLAKEKGVKFYFSQKVEKIIVENEKAKGIKTEQETVYADVVVSNMDIFPTYKNLLADQPYPKQTLAQEENWFVMINAPGNYGQDWETMIREARKNILQKVKNILGVDLRDLIETEAILDPRSIEAKTSSYRGALYGAASNSKFAAFLRHPNFTRKIKNLYFCGGSVHPGGGIPLCLLSAKIVAEIIE